ncbi:hypothetical protein SRABI05_04865 [Agrobacterium fabrum]|nr:hypothetical protein SRABI46_04859 [Agrobacterium fabrum]CAH0312675.1 hypothetical protein SRABI05_04865 [Agrobacterium fabrum]
MPSISLRPSGVGAPIRNRNSALVSTMPPMAASASDLVSCVTSSRICVAMPPMTEKATKPAKASMTMPPMRLLNDAPRENCRPMPIDKTLKKKPKKPNTMTATMAFSSRSPNTSVATMMAMLRRMPKTM